MSVTRAPDRDAKRERIIERSRATSFQLNACPSCRDADASNPDGSVRDRAAVGALRKRVALLEAVAVYARHTISCPQAAGIGPCGCGLHAVLARL